jgi:hypothetical protein
VPAPILRENSGEISAHKLALMELKPWAESYSPFGAKTSETLNLL